MGGDGWRQLSVAGCERGSNAEWEGDAAHPPLPYLLLVAPDAIIEITGCQLGVAGCVGWRGHEARQGRVLLPQLLVVPLKQGALSARLVQLVLAFAKLVPRLF